MEKDKIELKTMMESAAVADYLTALAAGFKSGSITIEKDGESLVLTPADTAEVEVEARMKKDKARFSLEVTWRVAGAMDEPASLKISAEAPKTDASAKPCCQKDDKKDDKQDDKKEEAKPAAKADVKPAPAAPATPAKPAEAPKAAAAPAAPAAKPAPKA